jgi:hypothetical protein
MLKDNLVMPKLDLVKKGIRSGYLFLVFVLGAAQTLTAVTLNVKDAPYGAKGDGITDDTAAFQTASDDAFSQSGGSTGTGGTVFIPNGCPLVETTRLKSLFPNRTVFPMVQKYLFPESLNRNGVLLIKSHSTLEKSTIIKLASSIIIRVALIRQFTP